MKKLLTILFLFAFYEMQAADYLPTPFPNQLTKVVNGIRVYNPFASILYVRTDGNNANTGTTNSSGGAWQTHVYAFAHASSGDSVVTALAGSYTETAVVIVPTGVSWHGIDSSTCIIKSTVATSFAEMIRYESAVGTNGNQSISGLKFEGQNATDWGIKVYGRSNIWIHDCSFSNFVDRGVIIDGGNNTGLASVLATGNRFYNNVMNNCAGYNLSTGTYARGCLNIGSQQGMLIYGNTITQDSRAVGYNGEPIKYWNGGFLYDCKLYNNTLQKMALQAANGTNDWDFCMELFELFGVEVYSNTCINGGLDLVNSRKLTYAYGIYAHDNYIYNPSPNTFTQTGVTLEYSTRDAIVSNNTIHNIGMGVYFTPRDTGNYVENVLINNNLTTLYSVSSGGYFVNFGDGGGHINYNGLTIRNNTFTYQSGHGSFLGIGLPSSDLGYIKNISITNNILTGTSYAVIYQEPITTIVMDSTTISNNDIYGNTGSDSLFLGIGHGTHFTWASNININPSYTGNYIPTNSTVLTGATDGGAIGWTGGTSPTIIGTQFRQNRRHKFQ